jgi:hypothetical protein
MPGEHQQSQHNDGERPANSPDRMPPETTAAGTRYPATTGQRGTVGTFSLSLFAVCLIHVRIRLSRKIAHKSSEIKTTQPCSVSIRFIVPE